MLNRPFYRGDQMKPLTRTEYRVSKAWRVNSSMPARRDATFADHSKTERGSDDQSPESAGNVFRSAESMTAKRSSCVAQLQFRVQERGSTSTPLEMERLSNCAPFQPPPIPTMPDAKVASWISATA